VVQPIVEQELKKQVAEIHAMLKLIADNTQVKDEKAAAEIAELRAAVLSMNAALEDINKVLFGNSKDGVMDVVDRLVKTVEGLGRIFENLHHEGQMKDAALADLVKKWQVSSPWREVALLALTMLRIQFKPAV